MTGIQIFLIFVGILAIVCSFVFAEKLESKDNSINKKVLNQDIEKLTKDIVNEQVNKEVDRIIDDKIEVTEVEIEKISNEKILAMGDYYETVIGEISKSHDEVMFLYGMLNDKEKDIKNTVRDIENVKKSIVHISEMAKENMVSENHAKDESHNYSYDDISDNNAENSYIVSDDDTDYSINSVNTENSDISVNSDNSSNDNTDKDKNDKITDSNEESADLQKNTEPTESGKTAESERYRKKGVALSHEEARKKTNNNQMILELYNEGKTNIEIAKQLKLGVGEVRLIIDLYKNRR